jgi:hypothetical protein
VPHRARRIVRLSAPLLAVALLPSAAANAAAPQAHLISLDQARTALPAGSAMPGHPQTTISSTAAIASIAPCLGPDVRPLTMKQSHQVTEIYIGSLASINAIPSQFTITAFVFHTVAAAKVGMTAIVHSEAHCPKQQGDSEGSVTRTASARYATDGWTGWRSIDHLIVPPDPTDPGDTGLAMRLNEEYLLRGNVVLALTESGALTPGAGPKQEADRKKATTAMLAGFAKL